MLLNRCYCEVDSYKQKEIPLIWFESVSASNAWVWARGVNVGNNNNFCNVNTNGNASNNNAYNSRGVALGLQSFDQYVKVLPNTQYHVCKEIQTMQVIAC